MSPTRLTRLQTASGASPDQASPEASVPDAGATPSRRRKASGATSGRRMRKLDGAHWEQGYRGHVLRDRKDQVIGRIHRRGHPVVYVWNTDRASGHTFDLASARSCVMEALRRGIWQPDLFEQRSPETRYTVHTGPDAQAPDDLLERAALAGCKRVLATGGNRILSFHFAPDALERLVVDLLAEQADNARVLAALLAEAGDALKSGEPAAGLDGRIRAAIGPYAPRRLADAADEVTGARGRGVTRKAPAVLKLRAV